MDPSLPFEEYADALERSGQYRVLRRLPDLDYERRSAFPEERVVAIIDTETTGLDSNRDDVIEFAGIAFSYRADGQLLTPLNFISQLQESRSPLREEIVRLTGINDTMIKGKSFDIDAIENFIRSADLIVAHNASFDRPFCEKISKIFANKPWACSATEVDWKTLGYEGTKLAYLVNSSGWFFDAHRALDDCRALAKVLSTKTSTNAPHTPFEHLLASAREVKWRIAFSAPFELRMSLRERGFRWKPGQEGKAGRWTGDFSEVDARDLVNWLTDTLGVKKATVSVDRITAFERYQT
ncbi:3'-5' exonuclease [Novosphingobium sp. fls2-241-R2A-195]|uniref:3'-5' exonuclease n=1 Tax=Novosphingobium sp. fls2-241-R2A-195 TaxID=3040296 RepID=UPI00254F1D01|nr:3'-5' exonuclease [Novosphingobium sp. fls2-241-R2A-195]